jgi:hypothetical protein
MGATKSQPVNLNPKVVFTESSKKYPQINGTTLLPCSFMDTYVPSNYDSIFGRKLQVDIRERCDDSVNSRWVLIEKHKYVNSIDNGKTKSVHTFETSDETKFIQSCRWVNQHNTEPNELAGVFKGDVYALHPFVDGENREIYYVNGQRCFSSNILQQYNPFSSLHRKLSEESS